MVLGGAPFNVAWHLQAFGLKPLMISRIGDDEAGWKVRSAMQAWGMDEAGLQVDAVHPTGRVEVAFEEGEPHYQIVDACAYDYISQDAFPELSDTAWLLYHGSLALRHDTSRVALDQLRKQAGIDVFLDINLRPPWWSADQIRSLIHGSRWIKLNEDELSQLLPDLDKEEARVHTLLAAGPESLILTRGAAGATVMGQDAKQYRVQPQGSQSVVDTVGAGDAFCSVLMAGLILGWPVQTTLQRAQAFASAVVGIRGATTRDKDFYRAVTASWQQQDV